METGLVVMLVVLLVVRAAAQQCVGVRHPLRPQFNAADAAKAYAMEWRMEAAAHIASLVIREQQCKTESKLCELGGSAGRLPKDAAIMERLKQWGSQEEAWERLLSSASLYEIARHSYQQREYDEAIIALEEALALRLFAYTEQAQLDRWQQGLVLPGSLFRRQKMDVANILVLRSDCLVQLAQEHKDVDDLTEAMELLQLATALLKAGGELSAESTAAVRARAQTVAAVAVELLPRLKVQRISEVLDSYGLSCHACRERGDYLLRLVPLLRLPVRVSDGGGGRVEAVEDPFSSHVTAMLRKPSEPVAQYMQRVFFRLLTMVPTDYLAELDVACRKRDPKGRCIGYLPTWVTAQSVSLDRLAAAAGAETTLSAGSAAVGGAPDADADGVLSSEVGEAAAEQCQHVLGRTGAAPPRAVLHGSAPRAGEGVDGEVQLCGFVQIKPIAAGTAAPEAATAQQLAASAAAAAAAAGPGPGAHADGGGPSKGVYYYYLSDSAALVERVLSVDASEQLLLLEELDALTAARRLPRHASSASAGSSDSSGTSGSCSEASLLAGDAPAGCTVVIPNFGKCTTMPLKPPPRPTALPRLPSDLAPPPPVGSYSPRFRKQMTDVRWARLGADDLELNHSGGGGGNGFQGHHHHRHQTFVGRDRELSDRQLQEQLVKMARDAGRRDRDDPLIPLTLAGCVLLSFGMYLASKRRRRLGTLMGLKPRLPGASPALAAVGVAGGTGVGAAAGAGVAGVASAVGASQLKRAAAAALRDAMSSGDAGKLEAAADEAEQLGLDAGLLARARVILAQRKKKERERAATVAAKQRALRKEQQKRQRAAERVGRGESASEGAGEGGAGEGAGAAGKGGSYGRRAGWLGRVFGWALCGVQSMSAADAQSVSGTDDGDDGCGASNGGTVGGMQCPSPRRSPDAASDAASDAGSMSRRLCGSTLSDSASSYQGGVSLAAQRSGSIDGSEDDGWQEHVSSKRKAKQQPQAPAQRRQPKPKPQTQPSTQQAKLPGHVAPAKGPASAAAEPVARPQPPTQPPATKQPPSRTAKHKGQQHATPTPPPAPSAPRPPLSAAPQQQQQQQQQRRPTPAAARTPTATASPASTKAQASPAKATAAPASPRSAQNGSSWLGWFAQHSKSPDGTGTLPSPRQQQQGRGAGALQRGGPPSPQPQQSPHTQQQQPHHKPPTPPHKHTDTQSPVSLEAKRLNPKAKPYQPQQTPLNPQEHHATIPSAQYPPWHAAAPLLHGSYTPNSPSNVRMDPYGPHPSMPHTSDATAMVALVHGYPPGECSPADAYALHHRQQQLLLQQQQQQQQQQQMMHDGCGPPSTPSYPLHSARPYGRPLAPPPGFGYSSPAAANLPHDLDLHSPTASVTNTPADNYRLFGLEVQRSLDLNSAAANGPATPRHAAQQAPLVSAPFAPIHHAHSHSGGSSITHSSHMPQPQLQDPLASVAPPATPQFGAAAAAFDVFGMGGLWAPPDSAHAGRGAGVGHKSLWVGLSGLSGVNAAGSGFGRDGSDFEQEVALMRTSADVAEEVLGSSPGMAVTEAELRALVDEVTS